MTITNASKVVFRLDATSDIGSGHAIRCIALAQAVTALGGNPIFAVSNKESAEFLSSKGYDAFVLGGCSLELGAADADTLSGFCTETCAAALFIDSYAVGNGFFEGLQASREEGLCIGYLDDLFTFSTGVQKTPLKRPVDFVLNYSLYADEFAYSSVYDGTKTKLLLGPGYVPLRREYWSLATATHRKSVRDVLVTSGATNPKGFLERVSLLACKAFPNAVVHVVVGPKASFPAPCSSLDVLEPQSSLLPLMKRCDVCVTAAGTTIYELSAAGVPSLAIAMVDNQLDNAHAFQRLGLGFGHVVDDTDEAILSDLVALNDFDVRQRFSERMQATVTGNGVMKVARCLLR
jgi:UDP-2,4-diacetamido-2,4,6-trideoxy-beta-L-altropyranose hydrolase